MDHRRSFSSLPARYDDFLFAPVCDDINGMRVSVLSTLARMDVDPWEEAGRLATMPRAAAARMLASSFDLVFGKGWNSSEAVAARLVSLLPPGGDGPAAAVNDAKPESPLAKAGAQIKSYWWVWVCFAIAMSFLSPHQQEPQSATYSSTLSRGAATPKDGGLSVPETNQVMMPAR